MLLRNSLENNSADLLGSINSTTSVHPAYTIQPQKESSIKIRQYPRNNSSKPAVISKKAKKHSFQNHHVYHGKAS